MILSGEPDSPEFIRHCCSFCYKSRPTDYHEKKTSI
ncbi:hypothetical protein ACP70R_034593 [Stipagrostis hirtigluma subsp. patula]